MISVDAEMPEARSTIPCHRPPVSVAPTNPSTDICARRWLAFCSRSGGTGKEKALDRETFLRCATIPAIPSVSAISIAFRLNSSICVLPGTVRIGPVSSRVSESSLSGLWSAISSTTPPPMECPTRWYLANPSLSTSASTSAAIASIV